MVCSLCKKEGHNKRSCKETLENKIYETEIIPQIEMDDLFIQRESVITTFVVPWVLGLGNKTPEQAKTYIKYGETLNPLYYQFNNLYGELNGYKHVFSRFMDRLFNDNNIDEELTKIIGDKVYKPLDCLSGIYQIEITHKMGLVARPDGITKNNECVIMVDDYITKYDSEENIKIKLLSTMAVWKAKKGIYVIKKMCKNIIIVFDESKWINILNKIKLWAEEVPKKRLTPLSSISITKSEQQAEENKYPEQKNQDVKNITKDTQVLKNKNVTNKKIISDEEKRKSQFEINLSRHNEEVLQYKKEPLYIVWNNSPKNYLYTDFRKKHYHLNKQQFDENFIKLIKEYKEKKVPCICGQILYSFNIQKHTNSIRHKEFLNPRIDESLYNNLKKRCVSITEYIIEQNNYNMYELI